MPFDINEFTSQIDKEGLLKPSLFELWITPPSLTRPDNRGTRARANRPAAELIPFLCDAASMPSVILTTEDTVRRQGIGPNERYAHNAFFTDVTFSFLGDGAGKIYNFFYDWINRIVGFGGYTSFDEVRDMNDTSTGKHSLPYTIQYKKDYVAAQMSVLVYRDNGEVTHHVQFNQVYPYIIAETPLNWGQTDDIIRFPITFTYRDWSLLDPTVQPTWRPAPGSASTRGLFSGSLTGAIYDVARGVNAVDNTSRALDDITSVFNF